MNGHLALDAESVSVSHPSREVAGKLPENIAGQHSDHTLVPAKFRYSNVGLFGKTITRWQRVEHPAWSSQTTEICWQTLKSMNYPISSAGLWPFLINSPNVIEMNQYAVTTTAIWTYCWRRVRSAILTQLSLITNITKNLAKSQSMVSDGIKYTSLYKTNFIFKATISTFSSIFWKNAWGKIMFTPFGSFHVTTGVKKSNAASNTCTSSGLL